MYDVIVVGAGPTGATAAKILAENKFRVLLVEKFKLPRNKSCSGVLIQKSIDLVKRFFGKGIPTDVTCAPSDNRGMVMTDDSGREFKFETTGLNVWRDRFDNFLVDTAREYGAAVLDGTTVTDLEEGADDVTVTLHGHGGFSKERARYIIDCEGVVGSLKRRLLNKDAQYITTYQTFNKGAINLDYHYFYAYLQPELSEYDAWFNVKDDFLIFGVAVKDRAKIPYYYSRFIEFMKSRHNLRLEKTVKEEKWLMPRVFPDLDIDYGEGRILFAGECAGFLNPMGEGISVGIESGYLSANAVCDGIKSSLSPYEVLIKYMSACAPITDYMARQWGLVCDMSQAFSRQLKQKRYPFEYLESDESFRNLFS